MWQEHVVIVSTRWRGVSRDLAGPDPVEHKTCKRCEQSLPVSEFTVGKAKCKACRNEMSLGPTKPGAATSGRRKCAASECGRYAPAGALLCEHHEAGGDAWTESELALTGGRWKTCPGGVKRWVVDAA